LNNVPYWETSFIESLKVKILQGKIEKMLKLQRSLEMLAHREMEKPDFSFAQECSNDRGLNVSSASPFTHDERTTSDALLATVNTLLQDSFTWLQYIVLIY